MKVTIIAANNSKIALPYQINSISNGGSNFLNLHYEIEEITSGQTSYIYYMFEKKKVKSKLFLVQLNFLQTDHLTK